ncbi:MULTISPECIES: hypothetical protein [Actinomadura]|nr:hypothetical protein [Actinomadura madurae]
MSAGASLVMTGDDEGEADDGTKILVKRGTLPEPGERPWHVNPA